MADASTMIIDKWYVVTKASNDGTFERGNHISLAGDGDILCREARGWIDAEVVPEASAGMEVEIDREWIARRKAALLKELEKLDG